MGRREELRGISRGKNAKDVDWEKVAGSVVIEVTEKPQPVKISVSEVLQKVRKPQKRIMIKAGSALEDKNSEYKFQCYVLVVAEPAIKRALALVGSFLLFFKIVFILQTKELNMYI